jgi:succinoglycan biosynthesis transport protein ExoP
MERARNSYREALAREQLLASTYGAQSAMVSDLAQRAIQYNVLEREAEGNRRSYDEMLGQVKQATVSSAVHADNIRVIDQAAVPKAADSPKPALNCALGLLLGSSCGLLFAFIRDRADSSLREPGDAVQHLGLTELGTIVHVPAVKARSPRLIESTPVADDNLLPALESYRAIVTSLLFDANRNRSRVLAVTSPGPGEGKTTVIANIGVMLASIGRRVMVIDGDTRSPSLAKVFGLDNDRGLSTLLEGAAITEMKVAAVVQETNIPGLSVLVSGPPSLKTADFLHGSAFRTLISGLRKRYDYVLIDTAPMLPVADARVIGASADAVICVARARKTKRHAVERVHQQLASDGIRVLGLILNDSHMPTSVYGGYADYIRTSYRVL